MNETDAGDAARHGGWFDRLQRARFTHLLIALSLLLVTAPLAGVFQHQFGRTVAAGLIVVVMAVVLIAAALAVSEHDRQSRVAIGLVLACILLSVPAHLMDMPTLRITQDVLTILLFAHIVRLIICALFRRRTVDYDTIAASLCGYLLIGVGFAVVYSLVIEIDADAIRIPSSADVQAGAMRFGDHTTGTALYFSFVTLTTLGYGDIAAVSMPARLLTTAEAVIGQFYLVVLVARMVGLHIANEMRESRDE
jgi:hypothetical protein